jgi:hypothetical protein
MKLIIEIDTELYTTYVVMLNKKGMNAKEEIVKYIESKVKKEKVDKEPNMKGFKM